MLFIFDELFEHSSVSLGLVDFAVEQVENLKETNQHLFPSADLPTLNAIWVI